MPISWVNILAGPPVTVDGRTLDGRTQWLLQLLARSGQPPIEQTSVIEARAGYDAFMLEMGGRAAPIGEIVDRTIAGPARAAAHPHLPPGRHGGAPAAGDPLFPRRRLGDGQPRRLRPGLPLFLRPRRLRAWSPSTTAWRPSTSSRPASTTPSPPIAGCRPRRRSSASIRRASSSRAIRPAATSPPWRRSCCATRRARPACNG